MILIKNEQKNIAIDTKELKQQATAILDILGYHDFDLGVLLTTNEMMQEYNRNYRGKDSPTDVLSFPYHTVEAGKRIASMTAEDKNLGDIIIAPHYVMNDLNQWQQSFRKRMLVLLVHGICHLLGYDHIEDKDYEVMRAQEEYILQHFDVD